MEEAYRKIIEPVGEDPNRDVLKDAPKRAANAMAFLTRGYQQTLEEVVGGALFESDTSEMVLVQDIELYSMCEHHLLPFIGKCHVAYLPTGKVLGLSKIARIVDMYGRRLQIQENMTKQIADAIAEVTDAAGVGRNLNPVGVGYRRPPAGIVGGHFDAAFTLGCRKRGGGNGGREESCGNCEFFHLLYPSL